MTLQPMTQDQKRNVQKSRKRQIAMMETTVMTTIGKSPTRRRGLLYRLQSHLKEDLHWIGHVWIVDCAPEGIVMATNLAIFQRMLLDSTVPLATPKIGYHSATQITVSGMKVSAHLSVRIVIGNVEHVTSA